MRKTYTQTHSYHPYNNKINLLENRQHKQQHFNQQHIVNTLSHCSYLHILYIFVIHIGKGRALESITSEGESTYVK